MKKGGLILWNAIAICEMFKTSWQMVKFLMKGDSKNHSKDQRFLLGQWLNINRFLHEASQGSTNLARKFYLEYSSEKHYSRMEFGEEIFWLQTLRNWKRWTHQKFILEESMQKKF